FSDYTRHFEPLHFEFSSIYYYFFPPLLSDYNHNKVNQWTAAIVEQSLTHLVKLGKTYKYIVTCAVMQRSGAGLHTASSCFWDTTTDGTCTVRWENRTMNCIVNVFAVAIIL
uniref:Dynein light chain Tctex-type 3 n=1 Tax=Phasianus colchicus TaxID=9054 RepID=A0A669Q303_PHACC